MTYAGITSAGLYQVNVTVPANLADGEYPVTAEVSGVRTAKFSKLAVAASTNAEMQMPKPLLNRTDKQQFFALVRRIRNEA